MVVVVMTAMISTMETIGNDRDNRMIVRIVMIVMTAMIVIIGLTYSDTQLIKFYQSHSPLATRP